MQSKSVLEWIQMLPNETTINGILVNRDEILEKTLKVLKQDYLMNPQDSMLDAILYILDWVYSSDERQYWIDLYHHIKNNSTT